MKSYIYSKPTAKGVQSFYLMDGKERYFLFSQNYRRGVQDYFCKGVVIDEAINTAKAHNNDALLRTMKKIAPYVKYIEKEYDIEVMEKTKERNRRMNRYGKRIVA